MRNRIGILPALVVAGALALGADGAAANIQAATFKVVGT